MSTVSKLGAVAASVVLLAGCGGGGGSDFAKKSSKDIAAAASTDMKTLKSVHLKGTITNSSDKIDFDMQVTREGDCHGTLKVGAGTAEIISHGGDAWMKPNDAFWKDQAGPQAAQIEQLVGDKWVVMPSSSSDLSSLCDLDSLLESVQSDKGSDSSVGDVKGTSTVNGEDAVEVDSKKDGGTLKTWVATGDKHYIVRFEQVGGDGPGSVDFTEFDQDFKISAPAKADVVDLSSATG